MLTSWQYFIQKVVVRFNSILIISEGPHPVDDEGYNNDIPHVFRDASHGDSEDLVVNLRKEPLDWVDIQRGHVHNADRACTSEPDKEAVFPSKVRISEVVLC